MLRTAGEALADVFGGSGGYWLITDLERGACGSIPTTAVADVHTRMYEALCSGDIDEALRMHHELLPLLMLFQQYNTSLMAKLVLQRQGAIASTSFRAPTGSPARRGEQDTPEDIVPVHGEISIVPPSEMPWLYGLATEP